MKFPKKSQFVLVLFLVMIVRYGQAQQTKPKMAGFEVNIGGSGYGAPGSYYGLDSFQNQKHNDHQPYPGLEKYFGKDVYMTEALTEESIAFMKGAVDKKQPFIKYLAHYGVTCTKKKSLYYPC